MDTGCRLKFDKSPGFGEGFVDWKIPGYGLQGERAGETFTATPISEVEEKPKAVDQVTEFIQEAEVKARDATMYNKLFLPDPKGQKVGKKK